MWGVGFGAGFGVGFGVVCVGVWVVGLGVCRCVGVHPESYFDDLFSILTKSVQETTWFISVKIK